MKRSERLLELANRVRLGAKINWQAELDAMALEQAAQDAEFAERVAEQSSLKLQRLSGVGDQGPAVESDSGSESAGPAV